MSVLIAMSRPQTLPAREFPVGHSAEILFFMGVRYSRMEDTVEKIPVRRRSAEQRRIARRSRAAPAQEAQA